MHDLSCFCIRFIHKAAGRSEKFWPLASTSRFSSLRGSQNQDSTVLNLHKIIQYFTMSTVFIDTIITPKCPSINNKVYLSRDNTQNQTFLHCCASPLHCTFLNLLCKQ